MRRIAALVLTLTIFAFANAEGRFGCRFDVLAPLTLTQATCNVQQAVTTFGPLEYSIGAEGQLRDGQLTLTPYNRLAYFEQDWWAAIEVALPWNLGTTPRFGFAVSFGFRFGE